MPANTKIALRIDEFDRLTTDLGWDTDQKRAEKIGISQSSISRVRSGERRPSGIFIHRVLTALKAPYGALFESESQQEAAA